MKKQTLATSLIVCFLGSSAFATDFGDNGSISIDQLRDLVVSPVVIVDPCPAVGECPEPFGKPAPDN